MITVNWNHYAAKFYGIFGTWYSSAKTFVPEVGVEISKLFERLNVTSFSNVRCIGHSLGTLSYLKK